MKKFYCYLKNETPIITEIKPENFEKLQFNEKIFCPNPRVARLSFEAGLKIKQWRSA